VFFTGPESETTHAGVSSGSGYFPRSQQSGEYAARCLLSSTTSSAGAGSNGRISESRSSISPVAIHAIMTARPFTSVKRFSPLGPRGIGIARFARRRRRRRGRAHWQRVDRWMMSLSHVLARWNLHFCTVGVFDQHAILIAPTVLDSADALRHRRPPPLCAKRTTRRAPAKRDHPRACDRKLLGRHARPGLPASRTAYYGAEGERERPLSPSGFKFRHTTRNGCWRGPARRRTRSCPKRNGRPRRRIGRIRFFCASTVCRIPNCIERRSLCPPSRLVLAYWRSQRPQIDCDRLFLFSCVNRRRVRMPIGVVTI